MRRKGKKKSKFLKTDIKQQIFMHYIVMIFVENLFEIEKLNDRHLQIMQVEFLEVMAIHCIQTKYQTSKKGKCWSKLLRYCEW